MPIIIAAFGYFIRSLLGHDALGARDLSEVARQSRIRPGQCFAIVLENKAEVRRPKLSEIAETMRATAAARGMTTEIFDAILAN